MNRQAKLGYSKPSTQVQAGPAPLASFEDLPTDDQFSEASLLEDLPCVSECLDDRIFQDNNLSNRRKTFQRSDTDFSADMNGSLMSITPDCSITPTELSSPTKTLTPVTPVNQTSMNLIENHFISHNQFMNQQQLHYNQFIIHQQQQQQQQQQLQQQIIATTNQTNQHQQTISRGRDETPRTRQSIEALKVPLSPSITLNDFDQQIIDEENQIKHSSRKGSWTNFFRKRSKSAGGVVVLSSAAKSPTPSFISFFSPKQSTNQLNTSTTKINNQNSKNSKRRRMSSIFSIFSNTFKKSTRSSLQDISNHQTKNNSNFDDHNNLLSTNLDKITSASSPKVLNDYNLEIYHQSDSNYDFNNCTHSNDDNLDNNNNNNDDDDDEGGFIETGQIIIENNGNNSIISLRKSFSSLGSVCEDFISQIVVKEKDEEFDKKIKEDIYLEEKRLDLDEDIPLEKKLINQNKISTTTANQINELDKKEVLLKRTLKDRSDTLDEIRSLPGRLPSFRRKNNQNNNDTSQANDSSCAYDLNSESDDQATTITDQLSSKKLNYPNSKKEDANNNLEIANLLEDEDTYNEMNSIKIELKNSPSRIRLQDKNERLNIKITPIERTRSTTPVNFATFETFINSSIEKRDIDEQNKIKLKLPEDAFCELVNKNGRRQQHSSPRKSSPQIWLEWERGLQTPKYNTRRNSNNEDQSSINKSRTSIEEAFTPSLANSSTNETISECLVDDDQIAQQNDNAFEDDFMNSCLADLAHVLRKNQFSDDELTTKEDHILQMHSANSTIECFQATFEANFSIDENDIDQSAIDQNNNLIVDKITSSYGNHCDQLLIHETEFRSSSSPPSTTTPATKENEKQLNCLNDNESVEDAKYNYSPTKRNCSTAAILNHQRRHSISSDISSASSRLICSSTSSSSNSSRRMSLQDNISTERLD